ncbi:MAG TPA: hypothetical protein PLB59_02080 [Bacteroidales bacterium]|jgi:drug/metabolite transporter (DMT)-like permease|nr:hypothetical protein [Bacteroidales bacterium]HNZ42684.1 hypothetical protein [Bacteroidales bacterium]HPB25470.1 hypothetical protein [Bacteroidales bacterium]HPI29599.1 hypothetical protein [Bacteroidales bacterium]HQN16184.1 hypothetical protein [Bacteroidales bacterium]
MTQFLTILVFILTLIIIAFIAYFLIKKFGLIKTITGIILFLLGIVLILFSVAYKEWIETTMTFLLSLFSGVLLAIAGGIFVAFGLRRKKNK